MGHDNGNLGREGHVAGTFGGLAETTGRDRSEIQRAAARDDGSLADLIGESAAKKATRERLAALNSGHMMGSDVQAKLLARRQAWMRERQLEARAEVDPGPTLLGSRALRELERKNPVLLAQQELERKREAPFDDEEWSP